MGGPGAENSENTTSCVMTATRAHSDDVVVLVTGAAVWEVTIASGQDHGI